MSKLFSILITISIVSWSSSIISAQAGGEVYQLRTTSTITLILPAASPGKGGSWFKDANGKWQKLKTEAGARKGTVRFTLSPSQIKNGATYIVINKPEWLALDDDEPPRVISFALDGSAMPSLIHDKTMDLGWVKSHPRTLAIEVQDNANPINEASLSVTVNGKRLTAQDEAVQYVPDPKDKRKGKLTCSFAAILEEAQSVENEIRVTLDDYALDDKLLTRTISYKKASSATLPDGSKIFVDSNHEGYEDVSVLADGEIMPVGVTTYGRTWASFEAPMEHWIEFLFPKPRKVNGIEIFWANYQGIYWASSRYRIERWSDGKWSTVLEVKDNPAKRSSGHTFDAVSASRLRIRQLKGGGRPSRPDIMWVTEVKIGYAE